MTHERGNPDCLCDSCIHDLNRSVTAVIACTQSNAPGRSSRQTSAARGADRKGV